MQKNRQYPLTAIFGLLFFCFGQIYCSPETDQSHIRSQVGIESGQPVDDAGVITDGIGIGSYDSQQKHNDKGLDGSPTANSDLGKLTACQATDPRSAPVDIAVMPDDGETIFVDLIQRAQKSIKVFIYEMGTGGILDGLKKKAGEGKDVRVIFSVSASSNKKYFTALQQAGAKVLWSDPKFSYMHAKVIIGDEKEAIISTGNFSKYYSIDKNRDYVARTVDWQDLYNLVRLFDADWERREPDLSCTRLLVSPVNARPRLLALINSAQKSLSIESMQFADYDIRGAVANRKKAGVDVRVILADPSWVETNSDAAKFLQYRNIPVRWMANPSVHTKEILVDGKVAYIGSENLSYTSLSKNREIGIIFSDAAGIARIASTFENDWPKAIAFP